MPRPHCRSITYEFQEGEEWGHVNVAQDVPFCIQRGFFLGSDCQAGNPDGNSYSPASLLWASYLKLKPQFIYTYTMEVSINKIM